MTVWNSLFCVTTAVLSISSMLDQCDGFSSTSTIIRSTITRLPLYVSTSTSLPGTGASRTNMNMLPSTQKTQQRLPRSTTTSLLFMKQQQQEGDGDGDTDGFKLGKPINLPSLNNPQDAGPMFATCRSVTGVEPLFANGGDGDGDGGDSVSENALEAEAGEGTKTGAEFVPNKPIQLESLEPRPTFFGLEPKDDELRMKDGSMMDSGIPLFTGTVIMMLSIYFIYLGFFGEDVLIVNNVSQNTF